MSIRKKRGLVLEINDTEMVLLTPEGEFVNRPTLAGAVTLGQEVFYMENVATIAPPKQKLLSKWSRSGLAVAVVLLLLILTPALLNQMPTTSETVAFVTVDVNPSIEMGVDNNDLIISIEALNREGQLVVSSLNLIGLKSESAVEAITKKIVALGYINPREANTFMITVRPVKLGNKIAVELEKKLAATTKETLAKDDVKYTVVQTALVDEELRLSAQVAGVVSPGRYLLMLNENQAKEQTLIAFNDLEEDENDNIDSSEKGGSEVDKGHEPVNINPNGIQTKDNETKDKIEVIRPELSSSTTTNVADATVPKAAPKNVADLNKSEPEKDGIKKEEKIDEEAVIAMLIEQWDAENIEKLYEMAALFGVEEAKVEEIIINKVEELKESEKEKLGAEDLPKE